VPGQPNNVGRGPLGVPTNSPISDPGTSARIQNRPNLPIGGAAPHHEGRKSTARVGGNRKLRTDRFPLLKLGARGNDVQRLQRLLNIHLDNDEQLKVDGIFGPKTRVAVLEFQKEEDLKPDAIVGRDTWFSLISAGTQEASWKAKPPAPPTKVVASSSTTATKKTVDQWTLTERFEYVLQHCAPYLGPDMRAQFTSLLTPVNLGIMVGSLVVWAAGHFFGVSEIADAFLLGFGLVFLGKAAIDAARLLKNVIEITCSASTEAELEDAAKDLAEAIAIIGVMAFFALLAKVGRAIGNKLKAAKAAEKGGAPAQEQAPIETKNKSDSTSSAEGSQQAAEAKTADAAGEKTKPTAAPTGHACDGKARAHILDGDATGGGHGPGRGVPGKSEFPSRWSDEDVINNVESVANDPTSKATPQGSRTKIEGTRDGVDIRVVVEGPPGAGGRIVTGFPTNVPRNP
jgi:peptidoglycan hydrolase-like protein with peptidoglycan-binding domain